MLNNKHKNPFKYYFVGTQIALTVFASVFIGYQLDNFFNHEKYGITIILSAIAIFYALYVLMRDVNK